MMCLRARNGRLRQGSNYEGLIPPRELFFTNHKSLLNLCYNVPIHRLNGMSMLPIHMSKKKCN